MDTTNFSLSRWPLKEWGAVLDIRSGRNQREVLDDNGTFPIIGSAGKVMGYANSYLCDEGTTVLGRKGTINNPLYFEQKFWNVDTAFGLVAGSELEKKFLYYFCLSVDFTKLDKGTTLPSLVKKDLVKVLMPVPGISEQKRIVAILDQAFADMEQARANTEKNLKNAHELFESYLQQVFSRGGEGWDEYSLQEVCGFKHGFAFKSEYFTDKSEWVLLTPGNFFEEGGYRDRGNKQKYYNGPFPDEFLLKKDSLLVAMTEQAVGLLGSPMLVPDDGIYLHNQRLGLIVLNEAFSDDVSIEFLYHFFNTKYFRSKVQESATGLKVRHTSPKKMQAISIRIPKSKEEQNAISLKLFQLKEETLALEAIHRLKLDELDELKKSILQKAFSGELTKDSRGVTA